MPSLLRIASYASVLSLIAGAASAEDLVPYWGRFTLDTTGEAAGPSQPRFDAKDNLKIAYRGHYDIKYVELVDGGLKWQVADTGTGGEAKMDFDLDNNGSPRIAYYNANYTEVYYAWMSGNKWQHRSVTKLHDKNYNLDWYQLCMTADSKGGVHLAYSRENANFPALWHTYIDKDGSLSDSGFVLADLGGKWNDMTLDANEKPVIAFFRHQDEQLRIAWQDGSAWKNQVIGDSLTPPAKGFHSALARENDTLYHVVYQDKDRHEIWMASGNPGGKWTSERIDSLPGFTFFASQDAIAMGKGRRPYVVYGRHASADGNTVTAGQLVFAYKEGDAWVKTVIDSSGITGLYAALSVDSKGMPAITYYELGKRTVKLALGSLTPVSLRRVLPGRHPAKGAVGPRRDASGRKSLANPARPSGRVFFARPD